MDAALRNIIGAKARDGGATALAVGCADDHVHVLVKMSTTASLADVVQRMKGGSAFDVNLHRALPNVRWQQGYWAESICPAELTPIAAYVNAQRAHHDPSHPAERWALEPGF